jgi:Tol biopolymer transport system component
MFPEFTPGGPAGLAPGTLVAGYRLEGQVGAGRTSVVYRARDERLGRAVALKLLAAGLAGDGQFRERFIRESQAAAAVGHPNILPVYEAGLAGDVLFVSMRLVTGDLERVLRQEGALAPARAAGFVTAVASALDAAHAAGLVHGAVKPGSVLLEAQPGWPEHAYLSDFGLGQGAMSQSGPAGTAPIAPAPEYSAPEQVTGRMVDGRADQYELACVAFALLAGTPPFAGDDPRAVLWSHASEPPPLLSSRRPGFPPAADQVLIRALAKAPEERYGGCQEFAAALGQALGLAPYGLAAAAQVQPPPPAQAYPAPPPVQVPPAHPQAIVPPPAPLAGATPGPARRGSHRLLIGAAVAGALLVAAAVIVPVLVLSGGRQPRPSGSPKPAAAAIHASMVATLTNPEGSNGVDAVAFSPDGATLALGDGDSSTYLWDVATGRLVATLADPPHSGGVMEVAFSPDGQTLATGDLDDRIHLWDVATGRLAATLTDPQAGNSSNLGIAGLAFSPDGQMLAAGDDDGSTYLWNVATARITATLTDPVPSGDQPEVGSIALSPGGTTLAAGDVDDSTYVWDVATGHLTATLSDPGNIGNGAGVDALAFSPDGKMLAAGDGDDNTYLWNVATGRRVATLPDPAGSQGYVSSVAFSPDGTTLAAGDNGGSTYLWDVGTGRLAATLKDPGSGSSSVDAVVFSPDGKTLAIAVGVGISEYTGKDNTYLWRIS